MFREIKNMMAEWRDSSNVGNYVFKSIRQIMVTGTAFLPDDLYAKAFYKAYTGKKLNLENPRYTNEKMWWLKLNNRDPLLTKCSDKHLAREYVAECGLKDILIPQLGVYDDAREIPFHLYKERVIVKCNNNSGAFVFFDPKEKNFNRKAVTRKLNRLLKQNYYLISREWNYKNIPPKIVVEKVIRDKKGNVPCDYRFFCFDGIPKILMQDIGVLNKDGKYQHVYPRNLYDMDYKQLPFKWGRDTYQGKVKKPENFEKMKEVAAKLSSPFPFCRVDLYNTDGKIYFGEITFYHGGCCQQIDPVEWDLKIAKWIDLSSSKIVLKKIM